MGARGARSARSLGQCSGFDPDSDPDFDLDAFGWLQMQLRRYRVVWVAGLSEPPALSPVSPLLSPLSAVGARRQRLPFKVVDTDLGAVGFKALFDELDVRGVGLVVVLRFFGIEDDIQADGVGLFDHGTFAGGHFTDVEMDDAGLDVEVLVSAFDEDIGGFGFGGVGPENDNVREHGGGR